MAILDGETGEIRATRAERAYVTPPSSGAPHAWMFDGDARTAVDAPALLTIDGALDAVESLNPEELTAAPAPEIVLGD